MVVNEWEEAHLCEAAGEQESPIIKKNVETEWKDVAEVEEIKELQVGRTLLQLNSEGAKEEVTQEVDGELGG